MGIKLRNSGGGAVELQADPAATVDEVVVISKDLEKRLPTAWVVYDGANSTIISSYNVVSVDYGGTGLYIINFEKPMDNTNYCVTAAGGITTTSVPSNHRLVSIRDVLTTTSFKIYSGIDVTSKNDIDFISVVVYGGKN